MPRPEQIINGHSKKCSHCKEIKSLNDFRKMNSKRPTRRSDCKECEKRFKKRPIYLQNQKSYSAKRREDPETRQKCIEQSHAHGRTIKGRATRLF